jgi:hypothetical protein
LATVLFFSCLLVHSVYVSLFLPFISFNE